MEAKADTSFFIDRMQGFGICVPVIAGIVQEFNDHEYHGHLCSKVVGQHVNVLKELVEAKLYKTRLQNIQIYFAYQKTGLKNLEYSLFQLNKQLTELDKTHIIRPSETDYFYNRNSKETYEVRKRERHLTIEQTKKAIKEVQEKFDDAKIEIEAVKAKIFAEHGIQY